MHFGRDRAQIGPWKSSETIAIIVPFPADDRLDVDAVRQIVDTATVRGYASAFTAAMTPAQAESFLANGFECHEELHLLRRPLVDPVEADRSATRRGRRADWDDVLELDALAFEDFWVFDRTSLDDAMRATPRHRFHVTRTTPALGYHVTGLAAGNGYIQRLAVHPEAQGQGWGTRLVFDALAWLQRNHAATVHVNTQLTNERAVALYKRCGFVPAPHRLVVLRRDL